MQPRRSSLKLWTHTVLGLLLLLLALSFVLFTKVDAGASNAPSINGTWECCGDGGATPQEWTINGATGVGHLANGEVFANITDSQNGLNVTFVTTYTDNYDAGYVATFIGKLSPYGSQITGTWTSNAGQSGTWTAHFTTDKAPVTVTVPQVIVTSNPSVAPIASQLGTPREIFHSMSHNIVNAILTVAVILFIAFPANIFNQTFSDNYDEIMLMYANERRRLRRLIGRSDPPATEDHPPSIEPVTTTSAESPGRSSRPWFLATLLVGAILGGLLNPKFGMNSKSVDGFLATIGAFAFGAFLSWLVAKNFRRWHKYPTNTYLKALPFGLGVAALCVIISRVSHFQPGYLYGIVVSFAFVGSLKDRHSAHLITISTLTTLTVALLAWFAWIPINHLALEPGSNFLVIILDDILGSIFVGGLVGTVVGLLPLEGLPGGHLTKWRRSVWAAVFFLAVFLLIEVELRPASGPSHPGGAPVVTAVVLFVLFGGLSFGMRRYFANRKAKKSTVGVAATGSTTPVDPESAH